MKSISIYLSVIALLTILPPTGSVQGQITDIIQIPDIIHYWTLDEDGGEIFQDSGGNLELRCTSPGCPTPTAGIVKGALNFDGVDDKLASDPAYIPAQSNGITVMAWINPVNIGSSSRGIIYKMACFLLEIDSQTGFIYWSVRVGVEVNEFRPTGNIPLNTWAHIAASYDGVHLRVYKNGQLADSMAAPYPGTLDNPFTPYQIGNSKFDPNRHFDGDIDEVAVFNRALTHAEIQSAYEAGLNGSPILSVKNSQRIHGFQLYPNFPNPFNPTTTLRFEIPPSINLPARVELLIFNSRGQHVKTLHHGSLLPGLYELNWDGDTDGSEPAASGVYYAVLKIGNLMQTRKLLLVK